MKVYSLPDHHIKSGETFYMQLMGDVPPPYKRPEEFLEMERAARATRIREYTKKAALKLPLFE